MSLIATTALAGPPKVVIDKRFVIAPAGGFVGIDTNLPYARSARASDGTLYVKAANGLLYVSRDNGQTWTSKTIDLQKNLVSQGVEAAHADLLGQNYGPFGIVGDDRMVLCHQTFTIWGQDLWVSTSDDFGDTWITRPVDLDAIQPPGVPDGQRYMLHYASVGSVFELADGTICLGVLYYPAVHWHAPEVWPSDLPTGEALIRSTDGGKTWGDATYIGPDHDRYMLECDYATDPRNPDRFFTIARNQRPPSLVKASSPPGRCRAYKKAASSHARTDNSFIHPMPGNPPGSCPTANWAGTNTATALSGPTAGWWWWSTSSALKTAREAAWSTSASARTTADHGSAPEVESVAAWPPRKPMRSPFTNPIRLATATSTWQLA